ncbi:MAG: anthranilate phosphoribosyltransferase family protein [Xenococcaceae cyanobacterium MO_188.B29]|nr:anthranilate phosphoribosyltransferase family protein [Xenococcaceae cyanobacterium MO_188.B29]
MSDEFRELLKKVGSGTHTGKDLTRTEAAAATEMMLKLIATPAQIGAFMIAHRIKRPTPEELAGMLDAYDTLAPKLSLHNLTGEHQSPQAPSSHGGVTVTQAKTPVVFCNPYDGRSRTVPVMPITALILAATDVPVIMHGGECMPTKYGIPLIEIWQHLGIDLTGLSLTQNEKLLAETGISFIYLPQHFPQAQALVPYREQIGKRPPFATLELIWLPVAGDAHLVSGFVHPPTETRFQETFSLRKVEHYTTVKGLEGSCDLARNRTGIIGLGSPDGFERLHLHPRDYDLDGTDLPLESKTQLIEQIKSVIEGKNSELMPSAILNGGFYLWRFGVCGDLASGFAQAEKMLTQGEVKQKLAQLQNFCASKSVG